MAIVSDRLARTTPFVDEAQRRLAPFLDGREPVSDSKVDYWAAVSEIAKALMVNTEALQAVVDKHKHWADCGWDVPVIELQTFIDSQTTTD